MGRVGRLGYSFSLSKTSLTFKAVTGGISASQTITVTNTSVAALPMGTVIAGGFERKRQRKHTVDGLNPRPGVNTP